MNSNLNMLYSADNIYTHGDKVCGTKILPQYFSAIYVFGVCICMSSLNDVVKFRKNNRFPL